MKHRINRKKLGTGNKHHKAELRNLATQLLQYERIQTTILRAKLLKSYVEKIITRSKIDSLHNRRIVYKNIKDKLILKKLFTEIGVRYKTRNGGYTRIVRYKKRHGDGAELCYVELMPELLEVDNSDLKTTLSENETIIEAKPANIDTEEADKKSENKETTKKQEIDLIDNNENVNSEPNGEKDK